MTRVRGRGWRPALPVLAGALAAVALAACGDTVRLPEAPATGALTSPPVQIRQTGSALAQVDPSSVTFQLDDSGSLVVRLNVRSTAGASQTLALRASLFDSSHRVIGDAVGGQVEVAPGASTAIELTGPAPIGTIAAATIEVNTAASPTPTS